jgi:hypothetical protein
VDDGTFEAAISGGPVVLFGPPGAGKTAVVSEIIGLVAEAESSRSVKHLRSSIDRLSEHRMVVLGQGAVGAWAPDVLSNGTPLGQIPGSDLLPRLEELVPRWVPKQLVPEVHTLLAYLHTLYRTQAMHDTALVTSFEHLAAHMALRELERTAASHPCSLAYLHDGLFKEICRAAPAAVFVLGNGSNARPIRVVSVPSFFMDDSSDVEWVRFLVYAIRVMQSVSDLPTSRDALLAGGWLTPELQADVLRLIDGIRAALCLKLVLVLSALSRDLAARNIVLVMLAVSRRFGRRGDSDDHAVLSALMSMSVVIGGSVRSV